MALEALVLLPWSKIRGLFGLPRRSSVRSTTPTIRPEQVVRIINGVARRLPMHCSCLDRSITLEKMLARRGIHSTIRLGVRLPSLKFRAHSWVVVGDKEFNWGYSSKLYIPLETHEL